MKVPKISICETLLFILFLISPKAFAHPPKDIAMEFDMETKMVKVEVIHPVTSNEKHFVKSMNIFLNDELIVEQHFKSQSSTDTQEASYILIDAKLGDKIRIEPRCSIYGSLKKEFVIEGTQKEQ